LSLLIVCAKMSSVSRDVLIVKKVASRCLASSWSHQDVTYASFNNKPNLNVRYEKMINFATMIIVKDLFKDDKKLISYYFLP